MLVAEFLRFPRVVLAVAVDASLVAEAGLGDRDVVVWGSTRAARMVWTSLRIWM